MAPHSKTCCAIPAHLHVIELLCYASIFKATRYMKMKWTKVAGYSAVAPIYQRKISMECMGHLFCSFFSKISV